MPAKKKPEPANPHGKPITLPSQTQGLGEPYFHSSVGQTLRRRREELGLTLADISAETNIAQRYLVAIEGSKWSQIPHTVHVIGFIRQYARILGLDASVAATKYLLERGPLASSSSSQPAQRRVRKAIVGSRVVLSITIGVAVLGILVYLLLQLSVLAAPPALEITSPPSDQEITANTLEVKGKTAAGAIVSINDSAISVDDSGNFATTLTLNDGINTIRFKARNRAGKTAQTERNVFVHH